MRDGLLSRIRHPIRQTLFSSHFPIGVAIAACWCILKGASYKQAPCCLKWKHFLLKNLFCPLGPTVKLCVKISTPLSADIDIICLQEVFNESAWAILNSHLIRYFPHVLFDAQKFWLSLSHFTVCNSGPGTKFSIQSHVIIAFAICDSII